MKQTEAVIRSWLDKIEQEATNLNEWEEGFIESVTAQIDRGQELSITQEETLERIYAQKTK